MTPQHGPMPAADAPVPASAPLVRLQISTAARLSLAAFQHSVPVLLDLVVVNEATSHLRNISIHLTSEPCFVVPRSWTIESVAAGASHSLRDLDLQLDGGLLAGLTEAETASLHLELRGRLQSEEVVSRQSTPVALLAPNQWGGIEHFPELVAAFVQPDDPAIDHLLKAAALALETGGRPAELDGYHQGPRRAWELASAIWAAVVQQRLRCTPTRSSLHLEGQVVSSPSQVLDNGQASRIDLALLFAACLEKAHLNPLLIFLQGHVLVGMWLRDDEFTTCTLDDVTAVRKRLKLQEIIVFDPALAARDPAVSFSDALAHANRQLSEDRDDQFELLVDVQRFRKSQIRPRSQADSSPHHDSIIMGSLLEAPIGIEDAPELPSEVIAEVPTSELDPSDRLARWQRRLLDLSLRNSLLNFRQGKRALRLEVDAGDLEDALAEGESIRLQPCPVMEGVVSAKGDAQEALKRREVSIHLEEQDLESRLVELYRSARTALQEGGSNTLFIALGFLVWNRPDKPENKVKAPLILLPVTLSRKTARAGFTLQEHDEEARFNPTLVEMLRQDFQLDLGIVPDSLPQDESGLDIQGIWTRVRSAIKDIRGWEVSEEVVLSIFSFAKYLMWKDLTDRADDLRKSPVVAHLIDTPREPYPCSIPFPAAESLDSDYPPHKVFSPLPADSSQLSAIMAAAQGKDLVLIGPPGTGKSQTIANLIAQCLADGKRVLFVSEKIAALEVVYRRLQEVGLGEFCLELHSNKSRKAEVLSQLRRAWEATGEVDSATWKAMAERLGDVRSQLSTYVERLHFRHPNGWSIFKAIGCVAAGQNQPDLQLRWDSAELHGHQHDQLRALVTKLEIHSAAVGPEHLLQGPLVPVHATDWSAKWQKEMLEAARGLHSAGLGFQAASKDLGQLIGIEWPALDRERRAALGLFAETLPLASVQDWSFCARPDSEALCRSLRTAHDLLQQHRDISAAMSAPWPEAFQAQCASALDLLEADQQLRAQLQPPWPLTVSRKVEEGLQLLDELHPLQAGLSVNYGAAVFQLPLAQLLREWVKADKAPWPLSWLGRRKVRSVLEDTIEGTGEPRVGDDLARLVRIKSLREQVEGLNPGVAAEGLWDGVPTRVDHARSALRANAALSAARQHRLFSMEGLDVAAEGHCGEHWAAGVQQLQALLSLESQLVDCAALSTASHGLWKGHETDSAQLRCALAFERERLGLRERGSLQGEHPEVAEGGCGPELQQQHDWLKKRGMVEQELLSRSDLAAVCPGVWRGLDTDLMSLQQAVEFHDQLSSCLTGLRLDEASTAPVRARLHEVLSTRRSELDEVGGIRRACRRILETLQAIDRAVDEFCSTAQQPDSVRQDFATLLPNELAHAAQQVEAHSGDLNAWCAWRRAKAEACQAGLSTLVGALERGEIAPKSASNALLVNYARWWLGEAVDGDDVLKRFVPAEQELRIQEFRALDDEFTQVSRDWIRAQLCTDLPRIDSIQLNREWGLLRRELGKKKKHMPLRQLMEEIPSVVLRLTPCLLMSPLSIAQYLSAKTSSFDLVVFDEASQIPVWDAVGAMARGRQVVMVGDPKQLPPTNFFSRGDAINQDGAAEDEDLESILDECISASLPTSRLSWHYRSRHENLIAFSNRQYYDDKLVTFPSPTTEDRSVSFHFVAGRYERGGARINKPEARALVHDLVSRLKDPRFRASGLSVGVVTFNSEQQELIEDLLDEERRQDPRLESYFAETEIEPIFVKNLESVQGDERDIMYFSITYGPDLAGALSMQFGPLTRDGGERRLNVAVTRARQELRVFASLRGSQIDLSRTQARGVRDLKLFLEFAEHGQRALKESDQGSLGDFESPFEAAVAQALSDKNWRVDSQIGASGFRVDLGIVHPDYPGRYLAGVECDGATYHRSATARDRDKLREQILRGLGWEILRIWSTEWWMNPGRTLDKVHSALQTLLNNDRTEKTSDQAQHPAAPASEMSKTPERAGQDDHHDNEFSLYRAVNPEDAVTPESISPDLFHESAYDEILANMVVHAVESEGPILDSILARKIAKAHGFQRTGSRIFNRVTGVAEELFKSTRELEGKFFWPKALQPGAVVQFRKPESEEDKREVNEICLEELTNLGNYALKEGLDKEATLLYMARTLGILKLRADARERLEQALSAAMLQRDEYS